MSFDLLPWETLPEAPEQTTETIVWHGGELVLPRLGYLTVTELQGIRAIERHGPFELSGDPHIMALLDELLGSFVAQQRMKLPGTAYVPCYRIVRP